MRNTLKVNTSRAFCDVYPAQSPVNLEMNEQFSQGMVTPPTAETLDSATPEKMNKHLDLSKLEVKISLRNHNTESVVNGLPESGICANSGATTAE